MRTTLLVTLLVSSFVTSLAAGQDLGMPRKSGSKERFQMLTVGGRVMLLDHQSGDSWLLAARGEEAAWIPIKRLDQPSIASSWLKANLPARRKRSKDDVSMTEATRQVKLEEITKSEVAAEPFNVLVARERAELTRLKAEYGDRHPEVVACRNRLRELLRIGSGE